MSVATAGGALGVGGGLGWNAAVGAAGGFAQTEYNNWRFGEKKNPFFEAAVSGVTGSAGYLAGDKATIILGGAGAGTLRPYIYGGVAGPATSEVISTMIDQVINANQKKINESNAK